MRHSLRSTLPPLMLLLLAACSGSDINTGPGMSPGAQAGQTGGPMNGGAAGTSGASSGGTGGALPAAMAGAPGLPAGGTNSGLGGASAGGSTTAMGGAATAGASGARAMAGAAGMSGAGAGAGGTSSLTYPPAAMGGDTALGIEQLNKYRATLGQTPVTLDPVSSTGCLNHLLYLIEEATKLNQPGFLAHEETDTANSHYSADNQTAGLQSDLAFGQGRSGGTTTYQSLAQAVDVWINAVYHRHPLLEPGLNKLGAASMSGYNCVNYAAPGNTTNVKPAAPVLWPPNGMKDVPRNFGGNEGPCPTNPANPLAAGGSCAGSGFIVSATFYNFGTNRMSALTSVSSVTLTDQASGMPVPLLTWYADKVVGHDPAPGYMQDEIALVPQAQLTANTTFRVDINAVVNGAPNNLSWAFTTGTRSN